VTASECETVSVFEEDVRLSQSRLWDLLRRFYKKAGVTAWSEGTIPWRITNNAFIAAAYARVVRAYLEDLADQGPAAGYDPARPVTILELGAGTGRFGFLFLRTLLSLIDTAHADAPKIRYVLTDVAENNMDFWMQHPQLAPLVAAGVLDFAIFDAGADGSVTLRLSGETLSDGTAGNPLVAIANYVFDSLPQDVFRSLGGTLHESRVTIVSPREENDPGDVSIIEKVDFHYRTVPADDAPYEDATWNGILGSCAARNVEAPVLFPVGALACLRTLSRIGGGRMLLLASDVEAGFGDESPIQADPVPKRYGGSFFLPVDFHTLGLYAAGRGGFTLHAPARHANMQTAAFVFGGPSRAFRGTCAAFARVIAEFGPADYHVLDEALRKNGNRPALPEALAFLRLSGFEPWTFHLLSDGIIEGVEKAPLGLQRIALEAMARVAGNDFPVGDGCDVPFEIGRAFWRMGRYVEALAFYRKSLESFGENHVTHYNMGLCHYRMGQRPDAIRCFDRCLEMDGSYVPAKEWKDRAESEHEG
jgi:hypothetical protein